MTQRFTITLTVLGLWISAGCSDGQPESAPPPGGPPLAGPLATPPVAAQPKVAPKATAKTEPAPRRPRLPDSPESHRFEVGADIPNFHLVAPTDSRSGALVALAEPPIGFDSSTFVVENARTDAAPVRSPSTGSVPGGFTPLLEAGFAEDGLPARIRCEKDGSEMVRVPAGLFLQGHDGGDPAAAPMHPVELGGYYIDAYEVTLGQYLKFWKATRPLPSRPANEGGADDLPVLGINWRDASAYLDSVGKQLPTEAEWEKAARGPDKFTYPWGDGRVLWHRPRTTTQIDPVGSFPHDRSRYGAFDLAGNAREWCADFYAEDAYRQAAGATGALLTDPQGPKNASPAGHRVVRGSATGWELWHRGSAPMLAPTDDIGFRGVLRSNTGRPPAAANVSPEVEPRRGRGRAN